MRMRKCLAVLAAVAVAVALAAGPVAAQQKVIKIGALYPLTGNLAATGMDCKRGVDLAVEIVNGKYDLTLPFAKGGGHPGAGRRQDRGDLQRQGRPRSSGWPRPSG